VRTPSRAGALQQRGVEVVEGDLADTGALGRLANGCAALVHAAGAVRGNSQEDFDRVNIAGTRAVLAAVTGQREQPRLLMLSSLAAREPDLSWYSRSKRGAEDLVTASDLDWIALRPPAVYGPGDVEMLPLFRAMARGIATVPGSLDARTSLIHVDDLVAGILACLESDRVRGQVLYLCDGAPNGYSWSDMAAAVEARCGRRVRLWRVPGPLLDAVATANSALARLTGRAPMLTPPKLRELRHPDWVVDNGAIAAATGWEPALDLAAGLAGLDLG